MGMKKINIYLPEKLIERFKKISEKKEISFAEVIRRVLDDHLEKRQEQGNENTKSTQD